MTIRPSAAIRQNYNEVSLFCKETSEPVFLTKNGEGDLVVMSLDAYSKRESLLKLREELLTVEEERLSGKVGVSLNELDEYLEKIIDAS